MTATEKAITTVNPPTMLTIRQTAKTGILPENALRQGVKAGWIPHIQAGNKVLINYNRLVAVLENC